MNPLEALTNRWPVDFSDAPRIKRLRPHLDSAAGVGTGIKARRAEIAKDRDLNPEGITRRVRAYAATEPMKTLFKASQAVAVVRSEMAAERALLRPKAPDPANFAAALLRTQIRAKLLDSPAMQVKAMILSEGIDPRVMEAIFEAPAMLFAGCSNASPDAERRA